MKPSVMRKVICKVLLVPPDLSNWSDYPNIFEEVTLLIQEASWYKIYDIAEALYAKLAVKGPPLEPSEPANKFVRLLNEFFVENGIGWELRNGQIIRRGSDTFAKSTREVPDRLEKKGFQRTAKEMREALIDISRRPEPDITGAIQHAMAALEATAREISSQPNLTLGKLVSKLDLPTPLDQAVHKLWGYASEYARHIHEGKSIDDSEAELIVAIAGSLCAFLVQRDS